MENAFVIFLGATAASPAALAEPVWDALRMELDVDARVRCLPVFAVGAPPAPRIPPRFADRYGTELAHPVPPLLPGELQGAEGVVVFDSRAERFARRVLALRAGKVQRWEVATPLAQHIGESACVRELEHCVEHYVFELARERNARFDPSPAELERLREARRLREPCSACGARTEAEPDIDPQRVRTLCTACWLGVGPGRSRIDCELDVIRQG
jgi:hypothetical protein